SDLAAASSALLRWPRNAGMAIAARRPMMMTTTSSSMRVNPCWRRRRASRWSMSVSSMSAGGFGSSCRPGVHGRSRAGPASTEIERLPRGRGRAGYRPRHGRGRVMVAGADVVAFVATTDLERARAFYEGVLGLPLAAADAFALAFDAHGTMLRVT